ncbi:hypothetical protein, variant [Cryptococcus amylolentus CBS 6039]|uniref:Uncharacterized protein n=1 Tax=Cryptococcus amylolentus CBS 6039 TaxID=1295533 RepID=A0A1E3HKK4_9TREE|nr:hypothetical protein, variant [Cryptococcus amylolentus CBS 6039]ODN76645.1 hypothetical protein, variant [Cryptococcus amylolentus CBS 6039]
MAQTSENGITFTSASYQLTADGARLGLALCYRVDFPHFLLSPFLDEACEVENWLWVTWLRGESVDFEVVMKEAGQQRRAIESLSRMLEVNRENLCLSPEDAITIHATGVRVTRMVPSPLKGESRVAYGHLKVIRMTLTCKESPSLREMSAVLKTAFAHISTRFPFLFCSAMIKQNQSRMDHTEELARVLYELHVLSKTRLVIPDNSVPIDTAVKTCLEKHRRLQVEQIKAASRLETLLARYGEGEHEEESVLRARRYEDCKRRADAHADTCV